MTFSQGTGRIPPPQQNQTSRFHYTLLDLKRIKDFAFEVQQPGAVKTWTIR
jgi:hypothetical protein